MMIQRKPLYLFFLLSFTLTGYAQAPHFQSYYLLKKNEPVQINTIFQDDTGFMWFGTDKGLFKYNGKTYQQFTEADSLPNRNVTAIAQDASGRIWTGHRNGELGFIEKGVFKAFNPAEGLSPAAISDILFDKQGRLWFATLNDGLYYFTRDRLYRLDEQEGMPDLYVYDILQDTAGNIWAGTDGGLVKCTLQKDEVSIDVLDIDDGLADNIVKKLAMGDDHTLWIATEDAGLIHYNLQSNQFTALTNEWLAGSVSDFSVSGKRVWIATGQPGLLVYGIDGKKSKQYDFDTGYNQSAITTLKIDREGNIWAGSKTGLIRTPGDHLVFVESFGSSKDINVIAVEVDRQGDTWYSTSEGLFKRKVSASGKVTIERPLAGTAFQNFRVISLFADDEGSIWAGLYGQGVLRIDPGTGKIRYLNKELRNGNVLNITGRGNTIWLATLGGSERITITGDKFEIKNFNSQNGLSSDFIYQVFLDSRDRVWFATDGKGVDMLDDKGMHHLEEGLPSKVVYGFAEDGKNQVWVNVQGNGIYKLQGTQFKAPDIPGGLRDSNVNAFSADAEGNLVVMHDLGIDVVDVTRNRIRYFGEQNGIRQRQATLNALALDFEGNLFFGTDGGIIQYAPERTVTFAEPHIAIESFKVFDQKIDFAEKPDLEYNENSITLNFFGLWYQNPEALHFHYTLDNFDEGWISTGDNAVTYSRLPAGDYTFRVKVSDNEDFSHADESAIAFTINPPFWRTIPFFIFSFVFAGAAGYAFIKYREKKLLHDKQVLEKKVEERTREIQQKTEEIQAQNEEIMAQAEEIKGINENLEMLVKQRTEELEKKNKALEEYAFINAHKLRSPLASILGLIHLIAKTNLDDEAREINRHLQQRADELDDVVRTITQAIERGER